MEALGAAIGDAIATVANDPMFGLVVRLMVAYVVLIWLSAALWAFVDMRRRSGGLVAAYGSAALVIVATPLLFPVALLVHVLVRPAELASDRVLDRLRHTAFELDADLRCEGCSRPIEENWLICPGCRRQLAHRCQACGGTVGLDWTACAWCGAEFDAVAMA